MNWQIRSAPRSEVRLPRELTLAGARRREILGTHSATLSCPWTHSVAASTFPRGSKTGEPTAAEIRPLLVSRSIPVHMNARKTIPVPLAQMEEGCRLAQKPGASEAGKQLKPWSQIRMISRAH
jgi:hypothetical protein